MMPIRDHLKQLSPLHYAATLFAPSDKRDALSALYLFDCEVKRIPSLVSEPMLGEIRLQWWREALNGERAGEAKLNPVASAMIDVMHRYALPLQGLLNLVEGETRMLDQAPVIDEHELEKLYGQRFSALFQLAAIILEGSSARRVSEASGHAGIAYGIARDLASGRHAVRRSDLLELGEKHLEKTREAIKDLPDIVRPAFLPLVIADPVLKSAHRAAPDAPIAMPSYLATLWRMLRFKI